MDVEEYGRVRNHWRWWERLRQMSQISTKDSFARDTDNALRNKIRASMLRNEPFTGNSTSKRATRRRRGKLKPSGHRTLNWEKSVYQAWLPDGYSQIFRIVYVWAFRLLDYGSAMLRCKI